ncbi:hypothetical protein DFH94DRAFT_118013 [Russula ochroleuca]|uniref:Uncharacterized protein n=1 Tax=Russula ochroleuca TaxID=152965 RepID=A0A9P5MNN9_9AGAM|nr:hypothetical protein DFH94DRAFT_118013 [Russula ochroleuca]
MLTVRHTSSSTELSTGPLLATSSALQGTILPLGRARSRRMQQACTSSSCAPSQNWSMVPMTLSVQLLYGPDIDINTVKGVGESIDGVMEILRAVYLKYIAGLFSTTLQPATRNVLRPYAPHALFVPPLQLPRVCSSTQLHQHATPF